MNHKLSLSYTGGSQLGVVLLALLSQGVVALTEASLIITGEDILIFLVAAGWDAARSHSMYRTCPHSKELPRSEVEKPWLTQIYAIFKDYIYIYIPI